MLAETVKLFDLQDEMLLSAGFAGGGSTTPNEGGRDFAETSADLELLRAMASELASQVMLNTDRLFQNNTAVAALLNSLQYGFVGGRGVSCDLPLGEGTMRGGYTTSCFGSPLEMNASSIPNQFNTHHQELEGFLNVENVRPEGNVLSGFHGDIMKSLSPRFLNQNHVISAHQSALSQSRLAGLEGQVMSNEDGCDENRLYMSQGVDQSGRPQCQPMYALPAGDVTSSFYPRRHQNQENFSTISTSADKSSIHSRTCADVMQDSHRPNDVTHMSLKSKFDTRCTSDSTSSGMSVNTLPVWGSSSVPNSSRQPFASLTDQNILTPVRMVQHSVQQSKFSAPEQYLGLQYGEY